MRQFFSSRNPALIRAGAGVLILVSFAMWVLFYDRVTITPPTEPDLAAACDLSIRQGQSIVKAPSSPPDFSARACLRCHIPAAFRPPDLPDMKFHRLPDMKSRERIDMRPQERIDMKSPELPAQVPDLQEEDPIMGACIRAYGLEKCKAAATETH